MSYVRGQERMVYHRTFRAIESGMMNDLGWGAATLPWGATKPLTVRDLPFDPKLDPLTPNLISMTEGLLPDDTELEMGGNLTETLHTIFVDIFGESLAIARTLATDVRSIFTGRAPNSSRYLALPNYAVAGEPLLPGHLLHFDDVEIAFPEGLGKAHWAVVKATTVHEWNL